MAHEVNFDRLDLEGTAKPTTKASEEERRQELLRKKTKVKNALYKRKPRILKIE